MNLQNKVLQDYRDLFGDESFKQISEKTGIQLTRVFRLFNGRPMKLNEYEVFKQLVEFRQIKRPKLFELLRDCEIKLSDSSLEELENVMSTKMRLWNALNNVQTTRTEVAA